MEEKNSLAGEPCPRCLEAFASDRIHRQAIQPLRGGALDALAVDGTGPICRDCEAAELLVRLDILPYFGMARTATGNCRMEQMRLPGAPMGLVLTGHMKPSEEGEFERHLAWLTERVEESNG